MEASKELRNKVEKASDSGAEKPIHNGAEPTINDQEQHEITTETLLMAARNSMVAWNTRGMAKLTLDDNAKNDIPRDEIGNIDCSKIKFDPGYMLPPLDIEKRLEHLRSYLDPDHPWYQPEYQHINIRAIIKLYENGLIDGTYHVYVKNGKLVPKEQAYTGPVSGFMEGVFHQYANKTSYGHRIFGNSFHEIRMLLRLIPALGGDGTTYGIIAMNDTGSDALTLYYSDFMHLGHYNNYTGWNGLISVGDANGVVTYCLRVVVEVLPVGNGDVPWRSNWITENAIVRNVFVPRLSGPGIRQ